MKSTRGVPSTRSAQAKPQPKPQRPEPAPESRLELTPLEIVAVARCHIREEYAPGCWRAVVDEREIRNTLEIIESAQAYSDGLIGDEASERAQRVAAALIAAFRSAKRKLGMACQLETQPLTRAQRIAQLNNEAVRLQSLLDARPELRGKSL